VDDREQAPKIKKVLCISIISAILVVVTNISKFNIRQSEEYTQEEDTYSALFMNIAWGLTVPACGYFGAKNRNRGLMSCFYGWSMALALCAGLSVFFWTSFLFAGGMEEHEQWAKVHHTRAIPESIAVVYWIAGTVQMLLNCAQFYYSRELLETEYFSPTYGMAPVEVNTTVIAAHAGERRSTLVIAQPYNGQIQGSVAMANPIEGSVPGSVGVAAYNPQPVYAHQVGWPNQAAAPHVPYGADPDPPPPAYTAPAQSDMSKA